MINDGCVNRVPLDEDFHIVQRPGCTYCFTRKLFNDAKHFWVDDFAHDRLLWTYAIVNKCLYIYNQSVIKFRRHDNNATGFSSLRTTRIERACVSVRNSSVLESIYRSSVSNFESHERKVIMNYIAFERARANALNSRSVFKWFGYNVMYRNFVYSLKSTLKDLYYIVLAA